MAIKVLRRGTPPPPEILCTVACMVCSSELQFTPSDALSAHDGAVLTIECPVCHSAVYWRRYKRNMR